ncbi:hypothetical protein SARC_15382 [Sphaeroforma arctica JP610]|uniref:Uncharacterized protein n=1 Tax=Sphaeroforma arctica JP610 TaxID=667725 RepID=A0A0L0F621_9EUKA|nr:hypothetical protein SARC_15382 [Sphaeroforma arctica JP610]KNC72069.1 hypothetical protein SARC_15382 [Sphaeroforma arctica JP610]|eukprot:XP_014145971.1 hypothetical protein SARC_15382 [Sphaeroforma arctica JP610]
MANAVMIHNITHSDLLLALQCNDEEWTAQSKSRTQTVGVEKGLMGRPQYAMFQPITNKVLRGIKKQGVVT